MPSLRLKLETTDNFSSDSSTDRQSATTLRAFMYWIATFCLAASVLIAYYVFSTTHGCGDGLKSEHAQCVGLTSDLDRMKPDPVVRPALAKILAENAAIPNWAPTVTVFYLGPLTKDPQAKSGDELNGSLGELTGLQARQHEYNEQSSDWRIKIEFANTGQDFRSAAFAAEKIRQRAQRDKRVAAVIGLAWSRKETQDAIRIIGRAQLPMLSTNNTADITPRVNGNDASPYFFRMAAPDSAQAEAMRWWLSRGLVRGGSAVPSERVAILEQQDTNDFYSADLAQAVRNELRGVPRLLRFSSRTDLQSRVREACEEGAQVLVYTGRTVYLDTLLDEKVKICQGPSVRILAGDDVSDAVAKAGAKRQWAYQTTMDFVALTNPQSEPGPNPALRNLPKEGAPTDARLAYDALLAVGYSLDELIDQQAPNATKADLNIAAGVLYNLRGLHSESPINGTSGQFSFTEERTDHTAVPRELWLNSVDWSNGVRSIAKCEFNSKRVTCH